MNLDKAIQARKNELLKTLQKNLNILDKYKAIEDNLPDEDFMKSINGIVRVKWGDLRIIIPWNISDRLKLIKYLEAEGWKITTDCPRTSTQTTWLTYLRKDDVPLDLWMKADFRPDGAENLCQIIKLGTKPTNWEETIYDVVCPGDV